MSTQKKLGLDGLGKVWEKVFELMKTVTGNVDVAGKGTLQEQIDAKASTIATLQRDRSRTLLYTNVTVQNTDLDNYKTAGIYYFGAKYLPTNAPTSGVGLLMTIVENDGIFQLWFRSVGSDSAVYAIYQRCCDLDTATGTGTWLDWVEYGSSANIAQQVASTYLPLSGGTMTGNIKYTSGERTQYINADGDTEYWMGYNSGGTVIGLYDDIQDVYIWSFVRESRKLRLGSASSEVELWVNLVTNSPTVEIQSRHFKSRSTNSDIEMTSFVTLTSDYGITVMLTENAFRPDTNTVNLGNATVRWKAVYALDGSINTSDRNLKDNIQELTDIHKKFFMKLVPVSFTFKEGTSGRTHIGFISQDVEEAMTELGLTALDFAGFCKDVKTKVITRTEVKLDSEGNEVVDEDGKPIYVDIEEEVPDLDENGNEQYIYSLRYTEFIAIIAYVLQDNVNRVESLEKRIDQLTRRLEEMEEKI